MVSGVSSENFRAKRRAIPKIEGEGGHAGICTGLREALEEKLGGSCKNFQR